MTIQNKNIKTDMFGNPFWIDTDGSVDFSRWRSSDWCVAEGWVRHPDTEIGARLPYKDSWFLDDFSSNWSKYFGGSVWPRDASPFQISHGELMRRARLSSKRQFNGGGAVVTDFSGWVFSLYKKNKSDEALEFGRMVERQINTETLRCMCPVISPSNWGLFYRDPLDGNENSFLISRLTVNDAPIRGRPDLVFKNKENGDLIIVERKASQATLPSNGWPNLKAQLWAYAHIDSFKDARKIFLVGEVWRRCVDGRLGINGVIMWNFDESEFYSDNAELFKLWGGSVND